MSCSGKPHIATPTMDRIADRGGSQNGWTIIGLLFGFGAYLRFFAWASGRSIAPKEKPSSVKTADD